LEQGDTLMATIHPTAVVDSQAEIADDVEIGPLCVVGPEVRLAQGVQLLSHVVIAGNTDIGPRTRIYPFVSLGHRSQDMKYQDGQPAKLEIGADNEIREHAG